MVNMRYKRYLDSIREVSAECQKLGIPYGEFVEVAQVLLDTKRSKPEFKDKAKAFLSSMSKYASERCKVLGLKDITELRNADPEFLQKAFRYHVTADGKLDKRIAQFAIYCHTKLDMFSFKDMENLRKDICKQMKIDLKEDDPKYWDTLLRAMPSYMQGDYPAKKPSIFERIELPDFTKMLPLTARYDILLKTLYPEALEAYGMTPDASDIDKEILVLGFDDTRAAMKQEATYSNFILYSANNVYMVCLLDGCILYEGNDSSVLFNLSNQSLNIDVDAWISERLSLVAKPEYFRREVTTDRTRVVATPYSMLGYTIYDLTPSKEAFIDIIGRVERSDTQYVIYKDKQKIADLDDFDAALSVIGHACGYGEFIENAGVYTVFLSDNNNYLLVDSNGTIVYIDTDINTLYSIADNISDDYIRTYIQNAYGDVTLDEIRTFLVECASTLVNQNLPTADINKLFCLTPLIAKQINKI